MPKKIILRDSSDNIVSEISSVISCDVSDRLCGEKTLSFETLMSNGLETMREDEKYTVEFENDIYDVVSFEKKMSSSLYYIKLDCEHVSYRLNDTELEMFSRTGTCGEILIELLKGTGFIVKKASGHTMTYSKQQSATVRAVLLDFAAFIGCDVVFERFNVSVIPHRGEILQRNENKLTVKILTVSLSNEDFFTKNEAKSFSPHSLYSVVFTHRVLDFTGDFHNRLYFIRSAVRYNLIILASVYIINRRNI
ncbi:MAG: hypothetical protein PUI48_07870 [Oscillospiraceae bacterium]|nr:hypothetical protein [Oscillospiraceae bacterium]MDY6207763.1 hypothetical protein [Oscillospiraceae bacterium]